MMPEWTWGRILVSAFAVVFVIAMVASSIRMEMQNARVQQSVLDGTTCILGNIAGRDDADAIRPSEETTQRACKRYEGRVTDFEELDLDMR